MNNSRASSDNNAISELAEKAGEARERMSRHRDAIYAAELSLLSGEPIYSLSPKWTRVWRSFSMRWRAEEAYLRLAAS